MPNFIEPPGHMPGGDEAFPAGKLRVRSAWISDLHLGTPGCQAGALLDFLRHLECETLFLVGDVVDGWQLRRTWYWPQAHNDVVQKLLRTARKGTRVIFVPGNHDEFARRYAPHNFGGIEVVDEWIYETADGRRLWVTHGDLFDGVIQCAKWLALVGDNLYGLMKLNRSLNSTRARLGMPYWSLSRHVCRLHCHPFRWQRRRGVAGGFRLQRLCLDPRCAAGLPGVGAGPRGARAATLQAPFLAVAPPHRVRNPPARMR